MEETTWEDFLFAFSRHYPDPKGLRSACRAASPCQELKRQTDCEARTPLSPYNLRLFWQTWFGIHDLLHPLVREGAACVLPMQEPWPGRAWLLEICPASTLTRDGLYDRKKPYKGKGNSFRERRQEILHGLGRRNQFDFASEEVRNRVLENPGGDALDGVVAALATARSLRHPTFPRIEWKRVYAVEGYVYT